MCGFSERNFLTRYELLERMLTKPKRGRKVAISPIDGFLLFLDWLPTAAPIDLIAGAFHLRPATPYKTLRKSRWKFTANQLSVYCNTVS
jgi:hypothetical protein